MDDFDETAAPGATASPRLFENALLDRLSRVHHLVPLIVYGPVVALLLCVSFSHLPSMTVGWALLAGYVIWTLVEYFGHRYLFHAAFPGQFGARIHFLIHGVHHKHPSDPLRLVMPPLLSLPIMAAGYLVLRPVCGPGLVFPVWAGFLVGYIGYDMVHYHVHHARPRTWVEQMLRRRHMLHHFRDNGSFFGVSAPWWDTVFGTRSRAPNPQGGGAD